MTDEAKKEGARALWERETAELLRKYGAAKLHERALEAALVEARASCAALERDIESMRNTSVLAAALDPPAAKLAKVLSAQLDVKKE